jgi:ribonucleotide reductase beta subunit family protein with ferritin-like domain
VTVASWLLRKEKLPSTCDESKYFLRDESMFVLLTLHELSKINAERTGRKNLLIGIENIYLKKKLFSF